jgi:quercetin dioxygenase-like cupin family protein
MRLIFLLGCAAVCASAQDPYVVAGDHYRLLFENAWARVSRATYGPHDTAPVHEHPPTPTTVYIYLTDGGEFRFRHMTGFKVSGYVITRPAVKAGAIRFAHSAPETHSVEYLGDQPTEYIRIELRTDALDIPVRDVRIPPAAMDPAKAAIRNEFENGQIRILRVVCAAGKKCPESQNPKDPSIVTVMSGPEKGAVRFSPKREKGPLEEVRIELKTEPVAPPK